MQTHPVAGRDTRHKAPAHPLTINRTAACTTVKNKKQEIIADWASKVFWGSHRRPRQTPTFITGRCVAGGARGPAWDHARFASWSARGGRAACIYPDDRAIAGAVGMNRRDHGTRWIRLCLGFVGWVSPRSLRNPTGVQHRQQSEVQPRHDPAGQSERRIPRHGCADRRQTYPVERSRRRTDYGTVRHHHPAWSDMGRLAEHRRAGAAVMSSGVFPRPGLPWIPPWVPVPRPPCRYSLYTLFHPLLSSRFGIIPGPCRRRLV